MTLFVTSVLVVLIVSALCSMTEAALYAVRIPYIRNLTETGAVSGPLLTNFKTNMERPITAILILNTVANTAGAAVAGSQAQIIFQPWFLFWFTVLFTLSVLIFSEIMPKVIGVVYNEAVARVIAMPLGLIVQVMFPLVWCVQKLSILLKPRHRMMHAPEEEVQMIARMSAEEGSIMPYEARLVQNVLKLNDIRARDIMTPRSVVMSLPADMTLQEVHQKVKEWTHSRIPLYSEDDPETWEGVVMTRKILTHLAQDKFDVTLKSLCKPIYFVSEKTPGHVLLRAFLKRRTHLFGVMHEHGGLVGIVTLEDVLESLIGEEIVDEVDTAVDMQELARIRHRQQFSKSNADPGPDED